MAGAGRRKRTDGQAAPLAGRRLRGRLVPAAAVLFVLTIAGAWAALARPPRPGVTRRPGLDVLLITIDTLRADAVGAYAGGTPPTRTGRPGSGAGSGATPWIDRLAAGGVLFLDAHAHNVVTLPSHANILSGLLPFEHGVRDNAGFRFPAGVETLATRLLALGYRTGAFVSAFPLESRFGLSRGFSVYDDRFADGAPPTAFVLPERGGHATVAAARRWMETADARPTFTWVHLYDPHAPYRPPPAFAERFPRDPYLGDVAAADDALRPLLGPILDGSAPPTLVVLTADHGESLGEHGEKTHGVFAYEATLRVPLILHAPSVVGPTVSEVPAAHVDIVPTILDALGAAVPDGLAGRSLLGALAHGDAAPRAKYFEALSGLVSRGWAPLYGVVDGPLKLVDLPLPELYALDEDPRESRNLVARRAPERERLLALLSAFRARDQGMARSEETAETRERLAALGYLASAAPLPARRFTADDDPKRLIALDALLETVIARHREGDVAGALALCEDLVARRPDMPAALVQLALLRRRLGRSAGAADALRRAVALAPADEGTVALLGHYLGEDGQAEEAVRLLETYAAREDAALDVVVALGIAQARTGEAAAAVRSLERARRIDPSSGMVSVQLATVHLLAGRDALAAAAYEAALQASPDLAAAHHGLGLIAARAGRDAEAAGRWRAALARDPAEHDTLLQLGSLLARQGRPAEARPYLETFLRGAPPQVYARERARVEGWLRRHAAPSTPGT